MKVGVSSMFFGDMRASELFSLLGKHPGARALPGQVLSPS
jgi:hypothetical protein